MPKKIATKPQTKSILQFRISRTTFGFAESARILDTDFGPAKANIGRGHFSNVTMRLLHTNYVAVKEFLPKIDNYDTETAFRTEVQWANYLRHPFIVSFLGFYEDEKRRYMFMELMRTTIHEELIGGNRADFEAAAPLNVRVRWALQLAEAIAWLHDRDLVHRDISSTNVMISFNQVVKLGDLTFVKSVKQKDAPGQRGRYMAPEVYNRTCKDEKAADVWALGLTILDILTGTKPQQDKEKKKLPEWQDAQVQKQLEAQSDSDCYMDPRQLSFADRGPQEKQYTDRLTWCLAYRPKDQMRAFMVVDVLREWDGKLRDLAEYDQTLTPLNPVYTTPYTFEPPLLKTLFSAEKKRRR